MNKAVFLDRDGTINVEKHYVYRIEDFEFLPGVIKGLRLLQNFGYKLVIITNQSGIARGYYTEHDFRILNKWMIAELEENKIYIAKIYYCPHLPDARIPEYRKVCNCRKPLTGLYEQAIRELNIDVSQSYSIGDKIRDCCICEKTECHGYLIGENEKTEIVESVKAGEYKNIRYAVDLMDAANRIVEV